VGRERAVEVKVKSARAHQHQHLTTTDRAEQSSPVCSERTHSPTLAHRGTAHPTARRAHNTSLHSRSAAGRAMSLPNLDLAGRQR